MDSGKITIESLIHLSSLTRVISKADVRKLRSLALQTIFNEGPSPEIQKTVMNGHLESPSATIILLFETGDILFKEHFIVMTILTSPKIELLLLQRNSTILDMRQRLLKFPFFSKQLKHSDKTYSKRIEITGKNNPSRNLGDIDDLMICQAITTTQRKQYTVLINNFLEHPFTSEKRCHIATFRILTPEHAKNFKPVNHLDCVIF